MIEVNLVPNVKQELLRTQSIRNMVISVCIIISIAAVGLVAVLGIAIGGQVVADMRADDAIKREFSKLSNYEDVEKIVTIQHQLDTIDSLESQRVISSRIFDILIAVNPAAPNDVRFTNVRLDPIEGVLTFEGVAANGFAATEVFKKTILNTEFEARQDGEIVRVPLATQVDVNDSGMGSDSSGNKVLSFNLAFKYPENLFSSKAVDAKIVTQTAVVDVTDSRTQVPDSLFSAAAKSDEEKEGEQ